LFPIPFPNEFPRDETFQEGLFKRIPEIIRSLLHRAYLYKHNETTLVKSISPTVRELMKETRMLNDRVTAFWEEYFFTYEPSLDLEPEAVMDWNAMCFLHGKKMSDVYDVYEGWHAQEFGDMDVEPSLKTFGGQYGAFLGNTDAGKFFTYRKTKRGRVVELLPHYHDYLRGMDG
jgi:phage/plasmid-associated DNA primase